MKTVEKEYEQGPQDNYKEAEVGGGGDRNFKKWHLSMRVLMALGTVLYL